MIGVRMAAILGLVIGLGLQVSLCRASEAAAQSVAPASSTAKASGDGLPAPTVQRETDGRPSSTQELTNIQAGLRASEERLRQAIAANKPSWFEKLLPAILGLVGVFVGGAINVWLQRRQMASGEKAQRATAAFEAQTKIIEYRSRQAHEFYHPLRLMLRRSSGVRRQLCDHLAKKNPGRFRMDKEPDGKHLFVYVPGTNRVRFRLIESMYELATQHAETLPMVDEIVAIGEKMTALIHDKGGLVLYSQLETSSPVGLSSPSELVDPPDPADSADLTELLGQYLAHFSILREVAAKAKNPLQLKGITYNVLYPIKLDAALNKDIDSLQQQFKEWAEFSARLWNEAIPDNPMPSLTFPHATPN